MGKNPIHDHRQKIWLPITLILILLVATGGYFMINHSENNHVSQTVHNKPVTSKKKSHPKVSVAPINVIIKRDFRSLAGTNSVYYYNLNDHTTTGLSANVKIKAASDIKLFIMAAFFQKIADGDISLSDRYTLTDNDKVGGSGVIQSMATGTVLSYKNLLTYMITQSDNIAANVLTEKIGGLSTVNDEIKKLGLSNTDMQRKLMDQMALDAGKDNYSSAKDLGIFLTKLYQHKVVSTQFDKQMLELLAHTSNHSKLPARIDPKFVKVYNKTGEYDTYGVQNDAAIFKHDQQAFIIVAMSENGKETDQKIAMGNLGADLAKQVFDY